MRRTYDLQRCINRPRPSPAPAKGLCSYGLRRKNVTPVTLSSSPNFFPILLEKKNYFDLLEHEYKRT